MTHQFSYYEMWNIAYHAMETHDSERLQWMAEHQPDLFREVMEDIEDVIRG